MPGVAGLALTFEARRLNAPRATTHSRREKARSQHRVRRVSCTRSSARSLRHNQPHGTGSFLRLLSRHGNAAHGVLLLVTEVAAVREHHRRPGLLDRNSRRVDSARLPTADAERLEALCEHDRVRPDVLAHAPREEEIAPLVFRRGAFDDLHVLSSLHVPVPVLYE